MGMKTYESEQKTLNLFALMGVLCTLAELIFLPHFSSFQKHLFYWISIVICFNSTHVVLTLVNIWMIPEYKAVMVDHYRLGGWKQFGLFLVFLFVFAMGHRSGLLPNLEFFRWPVIALTIVMNTLHNQKQTMGFSLLLNTTYRDRLTSEEKISFLLNDKYSRRWEHFGVHMMIAAIIPIGIYRYSGSLGIPRIYLSWAKYISIVFTISAVTAISYSFFLLRATRLIRTKFFFSLRYLVAALAPFSFIGMCFRRGIHGLEYLQLQETTFSRSRVNKNLFWKYLLLCIIFCLGKELLRYPEGQLGIEFMTRSWITKSFIIVGTSLTYLHYYLDSILYKMKDPYVRQQLVPILLPHKESLIAPSAQNFAATKNQ